MARSPRAHYFGDKWSRFDSTPATTPVDDLAAPQAPALRIPKRADPLKQLFLRGRFVSVICQSDAKPVDRHFVSSMTGSNMVPRISLWIFGAGRTQRSTPEYAPGNGSAHAWMRMRFSQPWRQRVTGRKRKSWFPGRVVIGGGHSDGISVAS